VGEKAIWKLFSEIWDKEKVPEEWGKGIIVPIPKKGQSMDPGNYRGITLLNVIPKLFTSIIHERLSEYCENEKMLSEEQGGFRKARSTIDQIFILHELTKGRFPKRTYACFLDIQKAYDRVWREGLWAAMYRKGISGKIWRVIRSLYDRVQSGVRINDGFRISLIYSWVLGKVVCCHRCSLIFSLTV